MTTLLDKWRLLVRIAEDPRLSRSGDVRVAAVLLDHFNVLTGRCDPSVETLAKRLATTDRSVSRALANLVACGYVTATRRGWHLSNTYAPIFTTAEGTETSPLAGAGEMTETSPLDGSEVTETSDLEVTETSDKTEKDKPRRKEEHGKAGAEASNVTLFPLPGGKITSSATIAKRDFALYRTDHGCTIDSYQPDPRTMGEWAKVKAPLVADPVSVDTVDEIKDVWRRRGEKSKDLDATYRNYLRQRNKWAAEQLAKAPARGEDKPRRAIAVGPDLDRAYE